MRNTTQILVTVSVLLLSMAPAFAQSASELLEKGIYLEETAGRVDQAIKVYRQIVTDATANRAHVAEALLRLGLCHLELGDTAAAAEAFERVLAEYPEQEHFVARAREHMPEDEEDRLELLPAPWENGEVMRMSLKLASGVPIGVFLFTADATELGGEELWRLRIRQKVFSDVDNQAIRQVLAKRDTMIPVSSIFKHSAVGHFAAQYGDGAVSIDTVGAKAKRVEKLDGLIFDNEESSHLVRRLPLEVGYKRKIKFLSTMAGKANPIDVEVTGIETITVPAGEFECYRVELSGLQVSWYSTDPSRILVKTEASGLVFELEEVYVQESGREHVYRDEELGFSFSLPPDWLSHPYHYQGTEVLFLLDPAAEAQTRMEIRRSDADSGGCFFQAAAQSKLIQARAALHDYALRDGTWSERQHAGWPAVSFVGDYRELDREKVHYWTFIEHDELCVDFTLKIPADRFEALRTELDSIIESYQGPAPPVPETEPGERDLSSVDGRRFITRRDTRVNEFTFLLSDAESGSDTLHVHDAGLNAHGRFDRDLGEGDLILVMQMQGAVIDGEPEDKSWGRILDYGNSGNWGFGRVARVADETLELEAPLQHGYDAGGRVQIVRVPRYDSMVIHSKASLTTEGWTGTTGGIVAISVDDELIVEKNAAIDASGLGFRGGKLHPGPNDLQRTTSSRSNVADDGAEKGEGIAGYEDDYSRFGGMYCYGAPANGGGGGNSHNAPGGGGGNAGNIDDWTGNGNPDLSSPEWELAWELEFEGFSRARSSGGGRGGYTWSNSNADALESAPGTRIWSGDERRPVGGSGGRPLDYSSGRLFLGGGGGAGDANGPNGTPGANGGGLIIIRSNGKIRGEGRIRSNGGNVRHTATMGRAPGDGPGGGGAGGTIVIDAESITGITITANGGHGGDQRVRNSPTGPYYYEAEGAGGGGGGGFISISGKTKDITTEANGGKNGVTDSPALTEFPPNGATAGGSGIILVNERLIEEGHDWELSSAEWRGLIAPDATLVGRSARLTVPVLRALVEPHLARGQGWTSIPIEHRVYLSPTGDLAWFEELYESQNQGRMRGTGVMRKVDGDWKFAHGNVMLLVPRQLQEDLARRIDAFYAPS